MASAAAIPDGNKRIRGARVAEVRACFRRFRPAAAMKSADLLTAGSMVKREDVGRETVFAMWYNAVVVIILRSRPSAESRTKQK
jgi:hypothetical protein